MEGLCDYEATGAEEEYDLTLLRVNGRRSVAELAALSPLPEPVAPEAEPILPESSRTLEQTDAPPAQR